ncbi:MAG: NADH-quinone oxidoreductase subunit C [Holosporales bacterium]|jgi:NADH:ubiquinone oxidoreductase subunit C|nr:NADH-quinone oxidoreductase subunit C [Holosporales bacterium]
MNNAQNTKTSRDLFKNIQKAVGVEFEKLGDSIPTLEAPKTQVVRVLAILRTRPDLKFEFLTDIAVLDHPVSERRFEVNYLIMSVLNKCRLNVRTYVEEDEYLDSIASLYQSANWRECEINEMFGIPFKNNRKMRQLFNVKDDVPLRKVRFLR